MHPFIVMGMFFGLVAWAFFAPERTEEQQDFLAQLYK